VFVSYPGDTREKVGALLSEGRTQYSVARALRLSPSTVSYHARRLGYPANEKCRRRYDWAEVQGYYDAGHTVRECAAHFGFSKQTWHSAVLRGAVRPRPRALPLAELLSGDRKRGRWNLKLRLLRAGLKDGSCEECGITEWRERPLSMALHHVNGDGRDNRLENLRLLCPNCHSQTENFAGKGVVRSIRPVA
jgi:5-methylcytosine-specific restriction endonuclease McrA